LKCFGIFPLFEIFAMFWEHHEIKTLSNCILYFIFYSCCTSQ